MICFLTYFISSCQTDNFLNTICPSSQSVSLGVYGNLNKSSNNGALDVLLPLYTINTGNIKLPISLSYRSNGMKFSNFNTWIGKSWTLNSSGIICRTIIGKEDKLNRKKQNYNDKPDIYNYNFLGYKGQFIINEDGIVKIFGKKNIRIEYSSNNNNTKWTVYTSCGYKLIFGTYETNKLISESFSKTKYGFFSPDNYSNKKVNIVSAWYLDEIVDIKTSESMKFFYKKIKSSNSSYGNLISYSNFNNINPNSIDKTFTCIYRESSIPILDSISFLNGKIIFDINAVDSKKTPIACILKSFKVLNPDDYFVTKFNFSYDDRYKLLRKIEKLSFNNKRINYYSFKYKKPIYKNNSDFIDYWLHYSEDNISMSMFYNLNKDFILNEIRYPEGARKLFEFENNDFSKLTFLKNYKKRDTNLICDSLSINAKSYYGLRLKSIIDYNISTSNVTKFSYTIDDSLLSSGVLIKPNLSFYYASNIEYKKFKNINMNCLIDKNIIEYSRYNEIKQSGDYIVNKFSSIINYPNSYLRSSDFNSKCSSIVYNDSWKRGNLLEKVFFNSDNRKVKVENYKYEFKYNRNTNLKQSDQNQLPCIGFSRLKSIKTTYMSNVNSYKKHEFSYDENNGEISIEKLFLNGNLVQEHRYDYPNRNIKDHKNLFNNHLYWNVVGESIIKQNTLVKAYRNVFKNNILPSFIEILGKNGKFYNGRCFVYESGNIVEVSNNNSFRCVLRDKYNQVIATIDNARISNIKKILSAKRYYYIRNNKANDLTYRYLNSLRSVLNIPKITIYKYKTSVGLISVNDCNGKKTFYSYDDFNNISKIIDFIGNIMKEYKYNISKL